MAMLRKAAEAREERAWVLRAVGSGEMTLADALDREAVSESRSLMKVAPVVVAALGERRADEVLAPLGINDTLRIKALSEDQRAAILAAAAEPA